MGRKRIYASTALRQQAYRERLKTGRKSAAPRSIDGAKLEEFYRKLRRRPVPSTDQCRFAAEWMSKAFALYGTELHPRLGEARKPAKRVRKLLLEVRENNQSLGLLARDRQINAELQGLRMVAPNADPALLRWTAELLAGRAWNPYLAGIGALNKIEEGFHWLLGADDRMPRPGHRAYFIGELRYWAVWAARHSRFGPNTFDPAADRWPDKHGSKDAWVCILVADVLSDFKIRSSPAAVSSLLRRQDKAAADSGA